MDWPSQSVVRLTFLPHFNIETGRAETSHQRLEIGSSDYETDSALLSSNNLSRYWPDISGKLFNENTPRPLLKVQFVAEDARFDDIPIDWCIKHLHSCRYPSLAY